MAPRWTPAEDQVLRRGYAAGRTIAEIATALGRSADAVTARRRQLRVPPRRSPAWSAREDALVRAAARRGATVTWLARRLARTPDAVRWRRRTLVGRATAAAPYTAADDEKIRSVFDEQGDVDTLARELGRSADAVRLRARVLGVHRPRPRRRWTFAEDAIVRDGYDAGLSCASIAAELRNRSEASVAARARRLGLTSYARRWTDEEQTLLAHLITARRSVTEIAEILTRTPEAVRQRARDMALEPLSGPSVPGARRRWTASEDALLRMHAGLSPATLAAMLGRSDRAIAARLRALGLRAGRERSPHHPAGRRGQLTPAQRSALARVPEEPRPETLIALAGRLDVSPRRLRSALAARAR